MTEKRTAPVPSRAESKAQQTHTVVMEILEKERDARQSKTERLRAQREARDAAEQDK